MRGVAGVALVVGALLLTGAGAVPDAVAESKVTEHASPMVLTVELDILEKLRRFEDARALEVRIKQDRDLSEHVCQQVWIGKLEVRGILDVRADKVVVEVKGELRSSSEKERKARLLVEVLSKKKVVADETLKKLEVDEDSGRDFEARLKLGELDDISDEHTPVLRLTLTVE